MAAAWSLGDKAVNLAPSLVALWSQFSPFGLGSLPVIFFISSSSLYNEVVFLFSS